MVDHMSLLREFHAPFSDLLPGAIGVEDCESLSNRLKNEKTFAEMYLVRHSWGIQQSLGNGELADVYGLPGLANPADGLTRV